MIRPAVVLHGDWGTAPSKRWVAKALERDGAYRVDTPSLAGDLQSLLPRAVESARGQVVAGFDFPIGVPASWAQQAGVTSFLEALPEFGLQIWSAFYDPPYAPVKSPCDGHSTRSAQEELSAVTCGKGSGSRVGTSSTEDVNFRGKVGRLHLHCSGFLVDNRSEGRQL
jgi:hypothetical protein